MYFIYFIGMHPTRLQLITLLTFEEGQLFARSLSRAHNRKYLKNEPKTPQQQKK